MHMHTQGDYGTYVHMTQTHTHKHKHTMVDMLILISLIKTVSLLR